MPVVHDNFARSLSLSDPISEAIPPVATPDHAGTVNLPIGAAVSRTSGKAIGMLVLITLLWGMSFLLIKNWHNAGEECPGGAPVAGLTMVALRMFMALVILLVFLPRLFLDPTRREFSIGLLLGGINSLGFVFQVTGLAWTSPALSAFVTS